MSVTRVRPKWPYQVLFVRADHTRELVSELFVAERRWWKVSTGLAGFGLACSDLRPLSRGTGAVSGQPSLPARTACAVCILGLVVDEARAPCAPSTRPERNGSPGSGDCAVIQICAALTLARGLAPSWPPFVTCRSARLLLRLRGPSPWASWLGKRAAWQLASPASAEPSF